LGLFCANPKAVELNSVLKLQIVLMSWVGKGAKRLARAWARSAALGFATPLPLYFLLFPIVLRIVFAIDTHCSCADGFSLALARGCIADGVDLALQIACIFFGNFSGPPAQDGGARLACESSARGSCPDRPAQGPPALPRTPLLGGSQQRVSSL